MSKQAYNDQTVTRYLLGSLPGAEAERLDELSFTDDEFAGALRIAEEDLVDAYVRGELTGASLEQFKSYYLASPLRREKVEFARALQVFAGKSAAARAVEVEAENPAQNPAQAATKRKASGWFSAPGVFTIPRPAWQWGTAFAALALLIAGGWLVVENNRRHQQISQTEARRDALSRREQELQKELEGQRMISSRIEQDLAREREERERLGQESGRQKEQAQQRLAQQRRRAPAVGRPSPPGGASIASFVLPPQMRGAGQIQTISIPAKTVYAAMRLQLEPGEHLAYSVALLDQSTDRTLWRSRQLKARAAGDGKTINASFPAGLLKPQVYVLRVTGVSATGASEIVSDYPFRVVKE
jgi:hypothetical protein